MPQSHSRPASPSSLKPRELHSSLQETWKKIEDIQEQMKAAVEVVERANGSLERLKSIEKDLLGIAAKTASLLSPLQTIPRDVVSEIAGNLVSTEPDDYSLNPDIWVISHVCKTWRLAILSLPQFWSTFKLSDGEQPISLELITTLLQRSGSHALSFHVWFSKQWELENYSPILSPLVEHAERWKRVDIGGFVPLSALHKVHARLPLLESLHIDLNGKQRWFQKYRLAFKHAPRLTNLSLTNDLNGPTMPFDFPLQQLRDVTCYWDAGTATTGICILSDLSLCTNLFRLELLWDDFWNPDFQPETKVLLPTLKYLSIQRQFYLLAAFQLPSLERLILSEVVIDEEVAWDVHDSLDSIPNGQLTHFKLSIADGSDGDCAEQLLTHPVFHGLDTLDIIYTVDENEISEEDYEPWIAPFLFRLTHGNKSPTLMPRLRDFSLRFDNRLEEDSVFPALKDFVVSRTRLVDEGKISGNDMDHLLPTRLESLHFQWKPMLPAITLCNFQQFEEGFSPKPRRLVTWM